MKMNLEETGIRIEDAHLALFFVEIPDLLLNRLEPPRLAAFATDTEGSAELPAEFHDTDGGQVDIFHIVVRTR